MVQTAGNVSWRGKLFRIVEIGERGETLSRFYDIFYTIIIILNLAINITYTFNGLPASARSVMIVIEYISVVSFAVDYVARIITAEYKYPQIYRGRAIGKYIGSFSGIVDLLSFLPTFLPFFFPVGAVAFRMFRMIRVFKLFRVNAYDDSVNIITEVLQSKKKQLASSIFIILILMLAASLCMYSLENKAQPDVFNNAFSGIWWAGSTLLTVGYGDIYPITAAGKAFGTVITFLGVFMVAIPTGIISAGFVEQYAVLKRMNEQANENDLHFIKVHLIESDGWSGKRIMELGLPRGVLVAAIQRDSKVLVPRGDVELKAGDALVIGAEYFKDDWEIDLKEIVLRRSSSWNGQRIRDLDISRQTFIVVVKREGKMLVPNGNLVLQEGDSVLLYTKVHMPDATILKL